MSAGYSWLLLRRTRITRWCPRHSTLHSAGCARSVETASFASRSRVSFLKLSVGETESTGRETYIERVLESHRRRARVRLNSPQSKSVSGKRALKKAVTARRTARRWRSPSKSCTPSARRPAPAAQSSARSSRTRRADWSSPRASFLSFFLKKKRVRALVERARRLFLGAGGAAWLGLAWFGLMLDMKERFIISEGPAQVDARKTLSTAASAVLDAARSGVATSSLLRALAPATHPALASFHSGYVHFKDIYQHIYIYIYTYISAVFGRVAAAQSARDVA